MIAFYILRKYFPVYKLRIYNNIYFVCCYLLSLFNDIYFHFFRVFEIISFLLSFNIFSFWMYIFCSCFANFCLYMNPPPFLGSIDSFHNQIIEILSVSPWIRKSYFSSWRWLKLWKFKNKLS